MVNNFSSPNSKTRTRRKDLEGSHIAYRPSWCLFCLKLRCHGRVSWKTWQNVSREQREWQ